MKLLIILLLYVADLSAAPDITDLGVMTPNRIILLEPCTNRADFVRFEVELHGLRFPSNIVSFATTNSAMPMEAFTTMPPGPVLMGVRTVCADGDVSGWSTFRFDLRRDPPKPPRARSVTVISKAEPQAFTNVIRSLRDIPIEEPPTPGKTNAPPSRSGPLPDGKQRTYSESMIEMHNLVQRLDPIAQGEMYRFWNGHKGRRNQ